MPVGLHLNLSEPFDGEDVPPVVRRRQAELATRFSATGRRWRRWLPDWRAQREIDRAIEDQLERFEMLYGRRPSHVDGHHHVHVSPSVARAPALAGFPLRRAIDDETPIPAPIAAARRARRRLILQGRTPTDRFVPISRLRTNLLGGQRPAAFGNANEIVEVMVHPAVPEERSLLVSSAWQELVRRERLTCYGELPWP
jgi:predicted glycoside hydrolase/deacetylase ChbG (UPF0249 family)